MEKGPLKLKSKYQVIVNQQFLPAILQILDEATHSIDLLAFSFAIASSTGKINTKSAPYTIALKLAELKKKQKGKLRIRFYTEGIRETSLRNRVTADWLRERGVEVIEGSGHAKGICVDGRFLILGSTNLTQQSITKNNEANIFSTDEALLKGFGRYFDHLWKGGKHGGVSLSPPLLADGDFLPVLLETIDGARKRIDFSIYFFNHSEIEAGLLRAHERGVRIRGFVHQHGSFALSYIYANRRTVKRLRQAGIEELHLSTPNKFSHSKYLVADEKAVLLGTANWLPEDVDIHPQLTVFLKRKVIARELLQHLEWQMAHEAQD